MSILGMFFFVFVCEVAAQRSWIGWMRRRHVSQVQKAYGTHIDEEIKAKVPSMGGVVFMLIGSGLLISAVISGDRHSMVFWSYPLLAAFVGLADDLLKFRSNTSEGLNSIQKFVFQVSVTLVWFVLMAFQGMIPQLWNGVPTGPWIWPIALFFAVGIQNAVNVSDGLDGLAAGGCVISFAVLMYLSPDNHMGAAVGIALSLGFLWHNCHPAQVFMGDGGAHFLSGLMASCAFCGDGVLLLVPAGAGFGLEILSVIVQLLSLHLRGKKVFLMSPVHHHFQLLGWSEERVVVRFWIVHALTAFFIIAAGRLVMSV